MIPEDEMAVYLENFFHSFASGIEKERQQS